MPSTSCFRKMFAMSSLNILSVATIDRLLQNPLPTVEELEAKYPPRNLPEGAKVTRVSPSPTGNMHIGTVYTALINERIAHQSGGLFFLRIEDTDTAREVCGAAAVIIEGLRYYGIKVDEGPLSGEKEVGNYSPYVQSKRENIYKAYIKQLLREGKAYPCFCTKEELDELRKGQEYENIRPGYYGKYAVCRNLTETEVVAKLDAGAPFVIRFRSFGDGEKKAKFADLIKGDRLLPENDIDIILLKSDNLPSYHFAHAVDDHLMRTTHVIRGDEWFSSLPLHIQLFAALGWRAPKYGHIAPLEKMDGESRRKLSKRKDPEASVTSYMEQGYPQESVLEYLMNLANSNFEDWRRTNPTMSMWDFQFSFKKLGESGALFGFDKLDNISKNVIARFSVAEIFNRALEWSGKYEPKLKSLMERDPEYVKAILSIERTGPKIRKDIIKWSDIYNEIFYFFDDLFILSTAPGAKGESQGTCLSNLQDIPLADVASITKAFVAVYNPDDTKDVWFSKIREIAAAYGYASNVKDYQANPSAYKGDVSAVAKIFRVLLTGRAQTPDLHSVMRVMGRDRVLRRLNAVLA